MMNMIDSNLSFENLTTILRDKVLEVTFNKVNGEQRVMPCTLREDMLPAREQGEAAIAAPNRDVIRVFAIDKQAWGSFRIANVTSIGLIDE